MRRTWAVYKRELLASFGTPLAYVIITVFLLWNGGYFALLARRFAAEPEITAAGGPLQLLFSGSIFFFLPLLLFCPALTMRSFAEERRTGTLETLMTTPLREHEVVLGKYFGALTVYVAMWAPLALYTLLLRNFGPIDWGALAAAYLGTTLIGAALLSLGLLASALASSQITAFIMGFFATSGLMFLLGLGRYVFVDDEKARFFSYVNLWEHMEHFAVGIVDTRHVVYYVSVAALGVFLTVRTVEARRGS